MISSVIQTANHMTDQRLLSQVARDNEDIEEFTSIGAGVYHSHDFSVGLQNQR